MAFDPSKPSGAETAMSSLWGGIRGNFTDHEGRVATLEALDPAGRANEIVAARGNKTTLDARIGGVIDDNGKINWASLRSFMWSESGDTPVYVSATSFKIVGVDRTAGYPAGLTLRLTLTSGTVHSTVSTAAFSADTTITIGDAVLDATLSKVEIGVAALSRDEVVVPAIDKLVVSAANIACVFLYDTSRDSDGGAWHKRAQHTSWFEEIGDLPGALLCIGYSGVSSGGEIFAIYNAMDVGLPKLLGFNSGGSGFADMAALAYGNNRTVSRIDARDGKIVLANSGGFGVQVIDLIADEVRTRQSSALYRFNGSIGQRNQALGSSIVDPGGEIAEATGNDVAIATLPGAPIDPATGLPMPTIVVATNAGVSVVHPWGAVADLVDVTGDDTNDALITSGGDVVFSNETQAQLDVFRRESTFADNTTPDETYHTVSTPALLANPDSSSHGLAQIGDVVALGSNAGLNLLARDRAEAARGMVAYVTKDYATGWMPGGIRLALADTSVQDAVGSGELVSTGDFASDTNWTKGSGWTIAAGVASCDGTQAGDSDLEQAVGINNGSTYVLQFTVSGYVAGNLTPRVGDTAGTAVAANGTYVQTIIAGAGANLELRGDLDFQGDADDVSLKLAELERSLKGNPLIIEGTVAKSAVAAGAEVSAWGPFSAANYLWRTYDADFDFGTADWAFAFWLNNTGNPAEEVVFARANAGGTGAAIVVKLLAAGTVELEVTDDGFVTSDKGNTVAVLDDGNWHLVVAGRRGSSFELWVDGALETRFAVTAAAAALDNATASLRIGERQFSTSLPHASGSVSQFRVAAYMPTPDQIARIHEDEKWLFRANALATLGGTSNAVDGLAHDPATDRLFVATPDGTSIFRGLERIGYVDQAANASFTSDDHNAVAAAGGAWLIASAAEAVASIPAFDLRAELDRSEAETPAAGGGLAFEGVTVDATPTDVGKIPVAEGETIGVEAVFVARQAGDATTERALFKRQALVYRDVGGNVTLQGSVDVLGTDTNHETTASMDATIGVDTAAQTVDLNVTGKAATTIAWLARVELTRITPKSYEAAP